MAKNKSLDKLEQNSKAVAEILKSMAHPKRLIVLCFLSQKELTVSELMERCSVSQSYLSQMLGRMKREGLVDSRREGQSVFYFMKDDRVKFLIQGLEKLFC